VQNSLNGLGNDRCNTVPGQNWQLSSSSRGQQVLADFNTSAFTVNGCCQTATVGGTTYSFPNGQVGTSGRNFLRGPKSLNTDLGLFKNFRFSERYGTLQFRAEFFNAFNQVHFNNPVNNLQAPNFGRITSAQSPRLIQFALKYVF
jgi:hypothetical protein